MPATTQRINPNNGANCLALQQLGTLSPNKDINSDPFIRALSRSHRIRQWGDGLTNDATISTASFFSPHHEGDAAVQRANQNECEQKVPCAFIDACISGNTESVRTLIKKTPSLVSYAPMLCHRYSGLHYAAKGGHHNVVRVLLDNGADVNLRTASGYTALHLAAICKQAKVIEVLLKEYRANCNIVDLSGHTFDYYAGSLMFDVWKTKKGDDAEGLYLQLRHRTSIAVDESRTDTQTNEKGPKLHCQNNCVSSTGDVTQSGTVAPCASNSTDH